MTAYLNGKFMPIAEAKISPLDRGFLFADGAYDRLTLMDKAAYLDFVVEIIRRSDDQKGFEV